MPPVQVQHDVDRPALNRTRTRSNARTQSGVVNSVPPTIAASDQPCRCKLQNPGELRPLVRVSLPRSIKVVSQQILLRYRIRT
jgi:hypothetical protein